MRRRQSLAAALAALVILAGCGGSDDGRQPGSPARTANGATRPQVIVETATAGFDAARVYREASPGVVTIRSIFGASSDPLGAGESAAEGSGFVLDTEGHVVTNAHVVTDDSTGKRVPARQVFVEFPSRNVVGADIVGFDPFADVALLKVNPDGVRLHPLQLGDEHEVVVGQPVAAIGSPFGEQQSLSVGVVSATDRAVKSLTDFQIEGAIQTDASINPGNSGGPLLDAAARVIGINQQIETNSGANDGVGFAVPISAVKRSIAQLKANGKAEYAYLGVSSQALYPQLAERLGVNARFGGLLSEVVPGGPADEAGLKGADRKIRFQAADYRVGGDIVLAVDGRKVVRPDDLARLTSAHAPGDRVTLTILRDGDRRDVEVTLGRRPETISSR